MVDAHRTFVIVGGGLAGAKAAETLRAEGFAGRVILICDERDHPYERPPLSKGFLSGSQERDSVFVHGPGWYVQAHIELHLGQPAVHLDQEAKSVRLGDGTRIHYDRLLLATGAEPRRLEVPGTHLVAVHHLRRLAHAERLRGVLASLGRGNGHLVIAGAGWIGLEVAAARGYGAEVTIVEPEQGPLHTVVGPELGALFTDLHGSHGVRFHFGARLTEITGQDGMVLAARTDDGEEHPAHAAHAAIGAAPRTALAEAPGLEIAPRTGPARGGIAVDAGLRTSDPDVFAAGDAAAFPLPQLAARAMLGQDVTYDRVPYFFSDQYDVGKRDFIGFWLDARGRLLAGMNVNVWDVTEPIQALIRAGVPLDPEALADPSVPLP